MVEVRSAPADGFDLHSETVVIGAGASGMVAALAASESGRQVLVVEADSSAGGATALSAGLIPAGGTIVQKQAGIEDSPEVFAADIHEHTSNQHEPALLQGVTENSVKVIDWLRQRHGFEFSLMAEAKFSGHSKPRLHGLPTRSGIELVDRLRASCERNRVKFLFSTKCETVFAKDRLIAGVAVKSKNGQTKSIACNHLILASSGFGANRDLVSTHMPAVKNGFALGHDRSRGDALSWGIKLDADTRYLSAYHGHGNVSVPNGILVPWDVIEHGGVQVNRYGRRFWNEAGGSSAAAAAVLAQENGEAFAIFDTRIASIARRNADFRMLDAQGGFSIANTLGDLACLLGLPIGNLEKTVADIPTTGQDGFGREFSSERFMSPYYGIRVTGALLHTQGGLRTNASGRVFHQDGTLFENLFACGGAAVGVSGAGVSGYLPGNGLLTAFALGYGAGASIGA